MSAAASLPGRHPDFPNWPITPMVGQIVFIDPKSKEAFAMDGDRRNSEQIVGNLEINNDAQHHVHIGRQYWTLAEDPRLNKGLVVIKGPYLITETTK
jgi:hypothetical protein